MTGKILGQMAVSGVILGVYVAMGLVLLFSFAMLGLLDFTLLAYLLIFFAITYLVVGALMAAVGAAVNDMGEAQSLMTPIMLVLAMPFALWFPISRDPNSLFSTIISFVPPVNTFAMLLRLTSLSPPPAWQVWLTIGIGVLSVVAALWFSAKVFRVGLLMHGKPPNLATLVRWVRMA
jgi:ABC-2 type transport system permease protein